MHNEMWKQIPGYEGLYEAGDLGQIRRVPGTHSHARHGESGSRFWPGRILKPRPAGLGYLAVNLSKEGIVKSIKVHKLVLLAFQGKCEERLQANHKNGNKHDNRLENLERITGTENI